MLETLERILTESWLVLGDMAPYLLAGFVVAGLLSVWISAEWTERHLGGQGLLPVVKATLLGVPLPLCSCGVIPVAASMRRHGATRAATTSFLLSTPQTGVDSIAVTYALLGPVFAVFRPIVALASGLLGGILVLLLGESDRADPNGRPESPRCTDACCHGDHSQPAIIRALRYGLITLPRDLGVALLVGVLVAGALVALAPEPNYWHAYLGGGILSMLAMIALGIPVYVCATASVPIAAGLIHLGASPGAALAFLIAGPASNAATIAAVWKMLGRRTAIIYLVAVAASAIGCGLLLDALFSFFNLPLPPFATQAGLPAEGGWVSSLWAILLLAVLAMSYWLTGKRHAG
jgi:uncharacterized protein